MKRGLFSTPGRQAAALAGGVFTMAFVTVVVIPPFYDWFCKVTGYGGTTSVAATAPDHVLDRVITVRFDASLEAGMPWQFRPVAPEMDIRVGETGLAFYEAYNPTDKPVAGQASYNVSPDMLGGYFTKIACFCFELQVLQPGERVEMPVSFFIDPAMADDPNTARVEAITLSYTFHTAPLPQSQATLDADDPATPAAAAN
ncbi:cytochrome c oxidase assembly protein [Pseudogemmobacter blasticus]|uniref:Cytochrome c oxidase assembly protein CtaG n=1 Tax=Fuscovulum blasticum DSM 2131 TaxID=1188250 RepID=A0A2T4J8R0_FUSBL|nr:cytochrome c oxidase assembly protein [Fuscovulum blasticum]PTE14300.1 cytochrome c oxidase assembly protein [Fuscovulum blasticum DSM 2131]